MSSPITFSGFNQIDFSMILESVMKQESAPLETLQTQQKDLQSQSATYRSLAGYLATFQSAVEALSDSTPAATTALTNTDSAAVKAVAGTGTQVGTYDVVVEKLSRAQVTAASTTSPDADETIVAYGGVLTFNGGVTVSIDGPVTLQQLAAKINETSDPPATATVIRASANSWQLILTAKTTGLAGKFELSSTLHGEETEVPGTYLPSGVIFATGTDGIAGNAEDENAVSATDARIKVNNVTVTSSTNTVTDAIPGVTLTLLKTSAADTNATITASEDLTVTRGRLQKVADAYNALIKFNDGQRSAAASGDTSSIARDPMMRSMLSMLRQRLSAEYTAGGTLTSLAAVGLEFDRTGKLALNTTTYDSVAGKNSGDLQKLFAANGADKGVFRVLQDVVKIYTSTGGLLRGIQDRLTSQGDALGRRMITLQSRLDQRRATLQKEYMEADMLMSRLNASSSSLSSLDNQYRLF